MIEVLEPVLPPSLRRGHLRRAAELSIYAGPHTQAAGEWLDILEGDHGPLARAGAQALLCTIDTRRFQLAVRPGAAALVVTFHGGGRRTTAAQLRRDNALLELALADLSETLGSTRAARRHATRLEALAPAWFRWTEADGSLPGLELAACADDATATAIASLLDDILVEVHRAAGRRDCAR